MERRNFLKRLAGTLYAAVGAILAVPALRYLTDPLRRRRTSGDFLRAVPQDSLAADRPTRVTLRTDRWDAFIHHPPGPVGNVWLTRAKDGANPRCLQAICPHLGCGIEYAADRNAFYCPCHASEFDTDGRRRFGPSPRDMDELPCRMSDADPAGVRWIEVQYVEFQSGVPDKRPLT